LVSNKFQFYKISKINEILSIITKNNLKNYISTLPKGKYLQKKIFLKLIFKIQHKKTKLKLKIILLKYGLPIIFLNFNFIFT
jgi:hypothetical protein